jgi:hypothetical protein
MEGERVPKFHDHSQSLSKAKITGSNTYIALIRLDMRIMIIGLYWKLKSVTQALLCQ